MGCWLVGGGEAVVVGSRRKERGGRGRGRKNDARDRSTTVMLLLFRDSLSLSPALLFLLHSLSLSLSPSAPDAHRLLRLQTKKTKQNPPHVGYSRERKRRCCRAIAFLAAGAHCRAACSSKSVSQGLPTGFGADGVRPRAGQRGRGLEAGEVEGREHEVFWSSSWFFFL